MIIVVLLIARVSSEWVEISQGYQTQEPPRHQTFAIRHTAEHRSAIEHATEKIKYINQSLGQWQMGSINKVSNIGNVRRVPYASVKTPSLKPNSEVKDLLIGSAVQKTSEISTVRNSFQNNKSKIRRVYIQNYQNASVNKNSHPTNFDSDFNDENRSILNDFKTYSGIINENSQSFSIAKINRQTSQKVEVATFPSIKDVFKTSKELIDTYGNKEDRLDEVFVENTAEDADVRKENRMDRVWEAVKHVADTISKHGRRGFTNKVRYLEDLKDTILISIEGNIDRMWPDDGDAIRSRRDTAARSHVEVPSSEGALMTISFLTFAVFLIKLVLQVIHAYKQKSMLVTPAVVAAVGRASKTFTKGLH